MRAYVQFQKSFGNKQMKSVCLIKFFATAQTTATENIAFSIDLRNEFLVFSWNFPDESEAFFLFWKGILFWVRMRRWDWQLSSLLMRKNYPKNRKAFQSNANNLLADSLCFIMNKFEHVRGSVQRRGWGQGSVHGMRGGQDCSPVEWGGGGAGARPCAGTLLWTDATKKIAFPTPSLAVVNINTELSQKLLRALIQ